MSSVLCSFFPIFWPVHRLVSCSNSIPPSGRRRIMRCANPPCIGTATTCVFRVPIDVDRVKRSIPCSTRNTLPLRSQESETRAPASPAQSSGNRTRARFPESRYDFTPSFPMISTCAFRASPKRDNNDPFMLFSPPEAKTTPHKAHQGHVRGEPWKARSSSWLP